MYYTRIEKKSEERVLSDLQSFLYIKEQAGQPTQSPDDVGLSSDESY